MGTKNLADAYDGEYLWLSNNEEEIRGKFFYGEEPSVDEQIVSSEGIKVVKERMAEFPLIHQISPTVIKMCEI